MKEGNSSINVYDLAGEVSKSIELPAAFRKRFRPDIIKKAVKIQQANKRQPYGPSDMAGMRHAVSKWPKGQGVSRVQRLSQGRRAAQSPGTVGGRKAHPPTPEKNWSKKMNKKERKKARLSALSALKYDDLVRGRGHQFEEDITLPLVVEDGIEEVESTQEMVDVLNTLGLGDDLDRAREGKRIRAGRGKMRGRKYKVPNSVLIVLSSLEVPGAWSAKNLPGVEVVTPEGLNAEIMAPGGDPGRLTLFSESAFEILGEW